jgi:hypothetical protein
MLNKIIQKVANLITTDVDPALCRVYDDIVRDLEALRESMGAPAPTYPIDPAQSELPLEAVSVGEGVIWCEPLAASEAVPVGVDIPLGLTAPASAAPPQPAPLPGSEALVDTLQAAHDVAKADDSCGTA